MNAPSLAWSASTRSISFAEFPTTQICKQPCYMELVLVICSPNNSTWSTVTLGFRCKLANCLTLVRRATAIQLPFEAKCLQHALCEQPWIQCTAYARTQCTVLQKHQDLMRRNGSATFYMLQNTATRKHVRTKKLWRHIQHLTKISFILWTCAFN